MDFLYIMDFLLGKKDDDNPFKKTNDELKVILDNARKIKNDNDTKINSLIRRRIDVEHLTSRDQIYKGEQRLEEIDDSINNIQIETELINSNLRKIYTVYIARTGNSIDINDLLIDVNNEIARLNSLLVETHKESIDPAYKEPRLKMLTENLKFEEGVKPILEKRISDLSEQWTSYDDNELRGGKRSKRKSSKRKSSKRKSSKRRKSAKRKNSKKNRK